MKSSCYYKSHLEKHNSSNLLNSSNMKKKEKIGRLEALICQQDTHLSAKTAKSRFGFPYTYGHMSEQVRGFCHCGSVLSLPQIKKVALLFLRFSLVFFTFDLVTICFEIFAVWLSGWSEDWNGGKRCETQWSGVWCCWLLTVTLPYYYFDSLLLSCIYLFIHSASQSLIIYLFMYEPMYISVSMHSYVCL